MASTKGYRTFVTPSFRRSIRSKGLTFSSWQTEPVFWYFYNEVAGELVFLTGHHSDAISQIVHTQNRKINIFHADASRWDYVHVVVYVGAVSPVTCLCY